MLFRTIFLLVFALVYTEGNQNNYRIIGGSNADIRDHPFQISLRDKGKHYCGGCIYKSKIIITAAHCVNDKNVEDLSIGAGSSLLSTMKEVAKVKKVILHEKYYHYENDIGILVLDRYLEFSLEIQPIRLEILTPPLGSPLILTGWDTDIDQLQEVKITLASNIKCRSLYRKLILDIGTRYICAGDEAGGKGFCLDAGGNPLVYYGRLLGIASFHNSPCVKKGSPDVYVSMWYFSNWIFETVKNITVWADL